MISGKKLTQKEQLELGQKLEQFYNMGYVNKKQALLFSLLKGIATGFGVFIGGTIVVAVMLWVLSLFIEAPLVGNFVDTINQSLKD